MGPEEAVELQSQTACPITEKTLLVAAPEDLVAEPGVLTGLSVFGDDILFTFDPFDAPDREYGHFNRCSGALERYPAFVPGLHHPRMITTDQGRVVYANDDQARPVLVDRFDVPGADEPQPVPGLPETAELGFFTQPIASPSSLIGQTGGTGLSIAIGRLDWAAADMLITPILAAPPR